MQNIETFKCASVMQRTPSTTLILPETPIPDVFVPADYDLREHHKRFDAALDGTTTRGQRALLLLIVLLVFLGWAFSLYLVWRMR